jgi:wyosine [tRNA(Phe)-imidazoG37] synthetase (radical SAM superfamily)
MKYKYLFGPVPSRRLGISLGVDLVPYKTCTLDCVYCECGGTTKLTIKRNEYISVADIKAEIKDYLSTDPHLDFITFSGGGEPTLNSGIGEITNFIKDNFPKYKIALLTNGTLFYQKELRHEVSRMDLIIPSLDAVNQDVFEKLNRPQSSLHNLSIVQNLIQLRKEFEGQIWLEIFIVPGLNDAESELEALNKTILQINPDKVQLNTLDRPSTEDWVKAATRERLEQIAGYFHFSNVEIVAKSISRKKIASFDQDIRDNIIATLKRRPCTAEDLAQILNHHINEINKYLDSLLHENIISTETRDRGVFLKMVENF